jgi:hypothetical protein
MLKGTFHRDTLNVETLKVTRVHFHIMSFNLFIVTLYKEDYFGKKYAKLKFLADSRKTRSIIKINNYCATDIVEFN